MKKVICGGQTNLVFIERKLEPEKSFFGQRGYDVIVADLKEDPEILKEKLQSVDIIDVGGGDVNYLLDWAKKANLGSYLKDLLARGVVYVGGSAGSMLPQPDIGFTWWEANDPTDHVGLGVVDFITTGGPVETVVARKKHLQEVMDFPWKIYVLQDGQAIKVDGDTIEHLGPGAKESV
ncbi:MAG: hypothetical protein COV10_00405 [Candidatus Vogelbacteria bacterium CG10_big_fil_rev_8_21_14_0_10_51_16]|uniref:Peptidase E n=1 Tax=Candidatus Vogelbacteria bacterium CG10_big_fil_rev_8_21_14_0_10_51_16 TaxID=1975045 RepID=A0A2H0RHJ2_9BACT|nr:MAG: hypothetical protein COV10_00405 [Candidatus Vogelbacteria bacterium CG10_big_fil_rev_8_21_14_0_10_51_16]